MTCAWNPGTPAAGPKFKASLGNLASLEVKRNTKWWCAWLAWLRPSATKMGKTHSTDRFRGFFLVGGGEHATVPVWRSEDTFEKLVLFFYHVYFEGLN